MSENRQAQLCIRVPGSVIDNRKMQEAILPGDVERTRERLQVGDIVMIDGFVIDMEAEKNFRKIKRPGIVTKKLSNGVIVSRVGRSEETHFLTYQEITYREWNKSCTTRMGKEEKQ